MPLTMSKKSSTRTDNDNSTPKGVAAGKSKDRSNRDRSPSIFSRLRKKLKLYNKDKHAAAAAKASAMAAIQEPAIEEPVRLSAMLPNVMPASLSPATATNESPAMMSGAGNTTPNNLAPPSAQRPNRRSVVPQFSRIPTLSRMESERRERLLEYPPDNHNRSSSRDRRLGPIQQSAISVAERDGGYEVVEAVEVDGDVAKEKESNQRTAPTSPTSLPTELNKSDPSSPTSPASPASPMARTLAALGPGPGPADSSPRITSASTSTSSFHPSVNSAVNSAFDLGISEELAKEMEWRWILNLSMHFRDESNREKFFVTYAQTTSLRRRLTISCDYRGAEEGTLEKELSMMKFQRDKSAKIYEAIRDSLGDIMFYETITNLKLQTSEGRLHVHVTEDINEIIPHPPSAAIAHLRCPKYRESELEFDSHLSGFVYKVKVGGEIMIKKEIPGPDTVDEFLYEINALYALADSDNVIQFGGCVIDDTRQKVKGLLISYASKGALIDILYNQKGHLPWERREKWAKQIVAGLSEIHEAGYVQGDFTLSNIVIDDQDNAKIIDINRRGCPVGWEPPEITAMIGGLQRIGMYIGVKSDIFQLGMVLWGMAHEQDEPEREARPLSMHQAPSDVPEWFQRIVESCLSDRPQGRPSAKDLLNEFPDQIVVSTPGGLPYLPGPPPITPGIPTDWRTANEYFPPTAYIPDQKLLLDGEVCQ
ncbi:kinase-like domain-containing protein [Pyronema omphalodes]|nr:kinase-like domain-containing protein [Pyronema omphalodes]